MEVLENLWRHHGRAEAREALAEAREPHPIVAELVEAVLAEPEAGTDDHLALRRQVESLLAPQWSVRMLRLAEEEREQLPDEQRFDWPAVLSAHATRPFSHRLLKDLAGREDCPEEFLIGILDRSQTRPAGRELLTPLAERARAVSLPVLEAIVRAPREDGEADRHFATMVRASLEQDTVTVDEVLQVLAPISTLCGLLETGDGPLNEAVGARVSTVLGTDPSAWRALWKLLPRWRQPLDDLLAAAAKEAGRTAECVAPKSAPYPSIEQFMHAPKMTVPRTALGALLNAVPVRIRLEVLPVLDELAQFDLLSRLKVEPELFDAVFGRGDQRLLRLLAANRELTDDQRARLLAVGDPDIHAQLYFRLRTSDDQEKRAIQREIAIGVRRFGTAGDADTVFADPHLVRLGEALRTFFFDSKRQWDTVSPVLESGQADIAIELLKAIRIPSGLLQLRMLLAVARRDGVTAAREVLAADLAERRYKAPAWDRAAHQAAQRALAPAKTDGVDDSAAVRRLVDVVAGWSGPERWISRLREVTPVYGAGFETKLDGERHTVDWSLLLREHEHAAFPKNVVMYLQKLPGCPLSLRWSNGGGMPSPWASRYQLDEALAAGETTLDIVLATGQPAAAVLGAGCELGWWQRAGNPLPRLCADLLGTDPDAWQLAVTLLGDFPGTVPELMRTAAAVVSPVPSGSD